MHGVESGLKVRRTASTKMNVESSRSHLVFSLVIETTDLQTQQVTRGKISFVDLAGSERVKKSGASGDTMKEAQAINKSLSALGDVIAALHGNQKHIPFRNSKLTYLLQDSLSRAARVLMVVNISPLEADASETICSLAFAARCRDVALGPASAKPEHAELARAKAEIKALKGKLERLTAGSPRR